MGRAAVAIHGAVALWLGAGVAWAQTPLPAPAAPVERPWEDPDAVDFDDDQPTSRFWDRTLHPHRDRYERELKRVVGMLASKRADDHAQAEKVMAEAVGLEPADPRGYFLLGHAHYLQREWPACAVAYRMVTTIDPKMTELPYLGASIQNVPGLIDLALGQCLSLSGDHQGAITRLQRAYVTSKDKAKLSSEIPWRLGEAYMALGRLDEAIANLRRAAEMLSALNPGSYRPPRDPLILYALAAAYDRDEQLGAARALMERLAPFEGTMTTFNSPNLRISPPEDVYYYKAMLFEAPTRAGERVMPGRSSEQALVLYRHFLKLHGGGPWARRTRAHIAALVRDPMSRTPKQTGSATFDGAAAKVVIERADEALQRCVKDVPLALFDVSITATAAAPRGRKPAPVMTMGGPLPLSPGVKAIATLDHSGDPEAITAAIQCLEDVAGGLKLPAPIGPAGSWGQILFPVVSQAP